MMGYIPYSGYTRHLTVTDTGVDGGDLIGLEVGGLIDWPKLANGNLAFEIAITVRGDDVYWNTGDSTMVIADVVSESDNAQASSAHIPVDTIAPNRSRLNDAHTKLGFKCNTGLTATVIVQIQGRSGND